MSEANAFAAMPRSLHLSFHGISIWCQKHPPRKNCSDSIKSIIERIRWILLFLGELVRRLSHYCNWRSNSLPTSVLVITHLVTFLLGYNIPNEKRERTNNRRNRTTKARKNKKKNLEREKITNIYECWKYTPPNKRRSPRNSKRVV